MEGVRTFKKLNVLFVCVRVWIRHDVVVFEGVIWQGTSETRNRELAFPNDLHRDLSQPLPNGSASTHPS